MGEQGLAERLAAETARNLDILEGLGERILGRLQDDAAMARKGVQLGALPRDYVRMFREYRTGLRDLRMEALLRQKLKLLDSDEMPMTEEEYQEALGELRREELLRADREELERELAARPQVRLPPASAVRLDAVALDVMSEERPTAGSDAPPAGPEQGTAPGAAVAGPAAGVEPDPEPDDPEEEAGWP